MTATNPCFCCWTPKYATLIVGCWSILYALTQLLIFVWQTFVIIYERDRAANVPLPFFDSYGRRELPDFTTHNWLSYEGSYYAALFWIQLFALVEALGLIFASFGVLYAVNQVRIG
jgi:hypothetical protein